MGALPDLPYLIMAQLPFCITCTGSFETHKEAAAAALKAGLDVELPNPTMYPRGLKDAHSDGLITEDDINLAVSRVLRLKFELGAV